MGRSLSNEQKDALKVNNEARAKKHLKDFEWDDKLSSDAEGYAKILAAKHQMVHSGVQGQGENLFMSSGDASLADAVRAWLSEEKNYHGEKIGEGNFGSYGHYTQCMWHNTTHCAVSKARGSDGSTWIVGRYSPPGNWMGEKPY